MPTNDPMELNTRNITKGVISLISGACTSYVVKAVVKNNIEVTNRKQAIAVWVGTSAIAGTVAYATSRNVERQIDDVFEALDKISASIDPTT